MVSLPAPGDLGPAAGAERGRTYPLIGDVYEPIAALDTERLVHPELLWRRELEGDPRSRRVQDLFVANGHDLAVPRQHDPAVLVVSTYPLGHLPGALLGQECVGHGATMGGGGKKECGANVGRG